MNYSSKGAYGPLHIEQGPDHHCVILHTYWFSNLSKAQNSLLSLVAIRLIVGLCLTDFVLLTLLCWLPWLLSWKHCWFPLCSISVSLSSTQREFPKFFTFRARDKVGVNILQTMCQIITFNSNHFLNGHISVCSCRNDHIYWKDKGTYTRCTCIRFLSHWRRTHKFQDKTDW